MLTKQQSKRVRRCLLCGNPLSMYNSNNVCFHHQHSDCSEFSDFFDKISERQSFQPLPVHTEEPKEPLFEDPEEIPWFRLYQMMGPIRFRETLIGETIEKADHGNY